MLGSWFFRTDRSYRNARRKKYRHPPHFNFGLTYRYQKIVSCVQKWSNFLMSLEHFGLAILPIVMHQKKMLKKIFPTLPKSLKLVENSRSYSTLKYWEFLRFEILRFNTTDQKYLRNLRISKCCNFANCQSISMILEALERSFLVLIFLLVHHYR